MAYQFRLEGLVSRPSDVVNDDGIDVLDRMAWVLDGATGISSDRLLPGPSDAAWFSSTIRQDLLDADGSAPSNQAALERALANAETSFDRSKTRMEKHRAELPAASCAIGAIRERFIEISVIGDCTVLLSDGDDIITKVTDQRVRSFDDAVVDRIVQLMDVENVPYAEALERAKPRIQRNREIRNRDTTYWVLEPNVASLQGLMTSNHELSRTKHMVMMTDGFYRLVDTYGVYTCEGLLDAVLKRGCDELYSELRQIEEEDADCRRHVRIKTRDDASCAVVRVIRFQTSSHDPVESREINELAN